MEDKDSYFNNALSNFIFDFACGGAIKHLADQGYSAAQIVERLDYPLSVERVREAVTAYYLEKGILLRAEPSVGSAPERYEYVQDHDRFGKPSFRRVPVKTGNKGSAGNAGSTGNTEYSGEWTKRSMNCKEAAEWLIGYKADQKTADARRNTENAVSSGATEEGQLTEGMQTHQARSYVSCDYGREDVRDQSYEALNERQREYLQGINWDRQRMYHLLDTRMREIVARLCEQEIFDGKIYLGSEKKIITVGQTEDK